MKKKALVLLVVVAVELCGYRSSFADPPSYKGTEDWVAFATVEGRYVGQPKELKVYYDKSTLNVGRSFPDSQMVMVLVWSDSGPVHMAYIALAKENGVWFYFGYGGTHIPRQRILKGSVMHELLKTLKRSNPIIDFND
jgi:hypothetical protein